MKNLKDNATTIIAVLFLVVGAVQAYLNANAGVSVDWMKLMFQFILPAVATYFIGKNPNGSTKVIDPATGQQDVNVVPKV